MCVVETQSVLQVPNAVTQLMNLLVEFGGRSKDESANRDGFIKVMCVQKR